MSTNKIRKQLKKPEILCPGGDLEKLKIAITYGADACYIAGMDYGLRTRAGNFTEEEMQEAVDFAHTRGAKVYVVANMLTHEGDEVGVEDFFRQLSRQNVDAVLISDPGLISICQMVAPDLAIHLSTQASNVNYAALNFWKSEGLERVVLGREASLAEIREMKEKTDIELECFMHGAMCVGYSGRCVLSNHMLLRDANRGGCAQPCRWFFQLSEEEEGSPLNPEGSPFCMSAADLSMIEQIPELLEAGIDSLKIEGRMKTIHYVSTVANVYRKAIDTYFEDPENYEYNPEWGEELAKVATRNMSTGFLLHEPGRTEQSYQDTRSKKNYRFVGKVLDYDETSKIATIQQRNKFSVGDFVEFYGPGFRHHVQQVAWLENEDGERIESCPHPKMLLRMPLEQAVKRDDLLRLIYDIDEITIKPRKI